MPMSQITDIIQVFEGSVKTSQLVIETNEAIASTSKASTSTPKK